MATRYKVGQRVLWYEDQSGPESGPEPPMPCDGPVLAVVKKNGGNYVQVESHYDGEPMLINVKHIQLARAERKRRRIVGGRRRA